MDYLIQRMKYDPALLNAIKQVNQCRGSLLQMKWCPYTLVMLATMNTTVFQRPLFTNTFKMSYAPAR